MEAITRESAGAERLQELFDAAMYTTEIDGDGDVLVRDKFKVYVSARSGRFVRFLVMFGFRESTGPDQMYEFANKVNYDIVCLRAAANADRRALMIDWYLPLVGEGLAPKTLITAYRLFIDMIAEVGKLDHDDLLG